MSLTSELKCRDSAIRQFFATHFPHTRKVTKEWAAQIAGMRTLRPDVPAGSGYPYPTVGMALDYRLRYYFGVGPVSGLVASSGIAQFSSLGALSYDHVESAGPWLIGAKRAVELADPFFESLAATLAEFRPVGRRLDRPQEETLCRYCYVLALFEQLYRAGPLINSPLYELKQATCLDDLLAFAASAWVADLCQLSWAFHDSHAGLCSHPTILNPRFAGSADIGGADADLIVDRFLVDFKTTVTPRVERGWLYQLLGYVLLDYTDQYRIDEVGIYFARQAEFVSLRLVRLLALLTGSEAPVLEELRADFQRLVAQCAAERHLTISAGSAGNVGPLAPPERRPKAPATAAEALALYPDRCPGTYEPGVPGDSGLVGCTRCSLSTSPRRRIYPWPHNRWAGR